MDLIRQGFMNAMDRAAQTCTNTADYSVVEKVFVSERQAVLAQWVPEDSIDFSRFGGCVIFAIVPYPATATVNVNGTQPYWVKLLNEQNQPLTNADAVSLKWAAGDASIASVASQGNQQAMALALQEGSTSIVPSLAESAYTATGLGIGTTQFATATLTVTKPQSDCAAYLSVKQWTVNIVASFSQKATGSPPGNTTETETDSVSHHLNYTFNISGGPGGVWQGSGATGQASVSDTNVVTVSGPPATTASTTATATAIGAGTTLSTFTLTIDPSACTYSFAAGLFAEVTFTHDTGQPPATSSAFGDGVRRAGDTLAAVTTGAVPTITGQAQLPAYNITSPQLGSDPNLNAYVPQLGEAPILSEILGDPLGSSATVSWTLTAVH
jgi:hypothetical protein